MEAQSSLLQRNTPTVKVLSRADSEGGSNHQLSHQTAEFAQEGAERDDQGNALE